MGDYSEYEKKISGTPVCELVSADVSRRDLFMLSRKGVDGYQSMSFSYQALFRQLSADLLDGLSVGSMAYQNKWKYAKAVHDHDGRYSAFGVSDATLSSPGSVQIASISVGATVYGVWAPKIEYKASAVPEIGTLRFVYSRKATPAITQESLSAEGWDGWAYPDGSEFEVDPDVFAAAIAVYGTDPNHIRLPYLGEFFSAEPSAVSDFKGVLPQRVGVENHFHSVGSLRFGGRLSALSGGQLSTYVNSSGSDWQEYLNNGNIHRGTDTTYCVGDIPISVDLDQVQFKGLSCGDCIGCQAEGEFRPRNVRLPVMVYIGGVQ